jgi:hypothetical protein
MSTDFGSGLDEAFSSVTEAALGPDHLLLEGVRVRPIRTVWDGQEEEFGFELTLDGRRNGTPETEHITMATTVEGFFSLLAEAADAAQAYQAHAAGLVHAAY